jgi:hypothetical protein
MGMNDVTDVIVKIEIHEGVAVSREGDILKIGKDSAMKDIQDKLVAIGMGFARKSIDNSR